MEYLQEYTGCFEYGHFLWNIDYKTFMPHISLEEMCMLGIPPCYLTCKNRERKKWKQRKNKKWIQINIILNLHFNISFTSSKLFYVMGVLFHPSISLECLVLFCLSRVVSRH